VCTRRHVALIDRAPASSSRLKNEHCTQCTGFPNLDATKLVVGASTNLLRPKQRKHAVHTQMSSSSPFPELSYGTRSGIKRTFFFFKDITKFYNPLYVTDVSLICKTHFYHMCTSIAHKRLNKNCNDRGNYTDSFKADHKHL
jgi:hypothetical protein